MAIENDEEQGQSYASSNDVCDTLAKNVHGSFFKENWKGTKKDLTWSHVNMTLVSTLLSFLLVNPAPTCH